MVLEVCGSAVQLVCAPARSLWPTLASAASTLALCSAANWGLECFLDEETSFMRHLLLHIVWVFSMPLFPILISFISALNVWTVKRSIQKRPVALTDNVQLVDRASITILCNCPLYIEIPSSTSLTSEDKLLRTRGYKLLVRDLKDLFPLELAPREAPTCAAPAAIGSSDQQIQGPPADHAHEQKQYLQFPGAGISSLTNPDPMKERELLLRLGLAPEYSQLRFLRSRNRFQAVVTTLQTGGYVLSVVQRLAQQLAVCPLEALVCFLSVIIMLQLLLELYACSHYQRPLLLRLNHPQFSQFWDASRDHDTRRKSPFIVISIVLLALPFSALSIYYSVHYMHSCLLCSLAALLFSFALLLFAIRLLMAILTDWVNPGIIILLLGEFIFSGSMVLAVVSSAKEWELFHSPTNNSFSWILPHVSSQA